MAFKGAPGTSNEEIKEYLHKNVGDFRPDWQSMYLDLVGAGELTGLGQGLAKIAKPAAIKQLSKGLKQYIEDYTAHGFTDIEGVGNVFRRLTRAIRRTPQELLDPLESVHFRAKEGAHGYVSIPEKSLSIAPGVRPEKVYSTLGHELVHIEDLKPYWKQGKQSLPMSIADKLEERAYTSMEAVGSLLQKGKMNFDDFITTINQDLDDLIRNLGGETTELFAKEMKPGQLIDVPGVGKVKYDAAMEPFEGYGIMHQYTIQEGAAKGATIATKEPGMDALIKSAVDKTKQFAEGAKLRLKDFDF